MKNARWKLGHWHPNQGRFVCALSNAWGGVIEWGLGPETPNGFRQPRKVLQMIEMELNKQLAPCPKWVASIISKNEGGHTLRLEIQPSACIVERHGLGWFAIGDSVLKCPDGIRQQMLQKFSGAEEFQDQLAYFSQIEAAQVLIEQEGVQLRRTSDGSVTLYRTDIQESYHSQHGSRRESEFVFIENGLAYCLRSSKELRILEVGLGTGLNAILSKKKSDGAKVIYYALEPYPIPEIFLEKLSSGFGTDLQDEFRSLHSAPWGKEYAWGRDFVLCKKQMRLQDFEMLSPKFDLIYFDAFAPNKQSEMWNQATIAHLSQFINSGGVLVTYCSQSEFRKILVANNFAVEVLQGPPGKRQMVRATLNTK